MKIREKKAGGGRPTAMFLVAAMALVVSCSDGEVPHEEERAGVSALYESCAFGLKVHKRTGAGAQEMSSGEFVRKSDVVQVSYLARKTVHGVIFSVDGRGVVSLHFPADPADSTLMVGDKGYRSLPYSFQLDDAPGFERFFFVTSDEPVDVVELIEEAKEQPLDPASYPVFSGGAFLRCEIMLLKRKFLET